VPNVCWEPKFSKSGRPTFVGNENFQNPLVQHLLGTKIFKIRSSNVCWEQKFSKSADPTFVEEQNFQNPTIQRLLRAKIFKIRPSIICWEPKFSKSDDPTFVEDKTKSGRVTDDVTKVSLGLLSHRIYLRIVNGSAGNQKV